MVVYKPLLTQCHYCLSQLYCYASLMDGFDGSSSADNTCRLSSVSNAMDRHSLNANVHNIAGFVADDPSSSLIVDALNSPARHITKQECDKNEYRKNEKYQILLQKKTSFVLPAGYLLFQALSIYRSEYP